MMLLTNIRDFVNICCAGNKAACNKQKGNALGKALKESESALSEEHFP